MFKLIRYFLIHRVTKNPMTAARIYQMIYHPEVFQIADRPRKVETRMDYTPETPSSPPLKRGGHRSGNVVLTEREEIEGALRELQSKPKKSVADKTSIDMLRAVLNNM